MTIMQNERFEITSDYDVPLLRLLHKLPDGQGETSEVCRLYDEEYSHLIPEEHRDLRHSNNQPIWYNNVCWSRARLKERGFLDMPRRGVWRITEAGHRWVEENPHAKYIAGASRRRPRKPRKTAGRKPPSVPGVTLEMLNQTRKLMPADEFRQVWGALYDQLLAEERAKAITKITQTELGRRTRRWLDDVHAFLGGEMSSTPSSEVLCDWMHFCYALDLHREAATLLTYVRKEGVDPVSYKRAKRVADVCRAKLTS